MFAATVLLAALILAVPPVVPAAADQTDPRLDALFARLKETRDIDAARNLETTIWRIWIDSDDEVVRTLMAQGIAAMARRDLPAALRKFDQIVAIAPDFAEGWNKRATVYYLMGRYDDSLADIERTLALEPRHFGALAGRGLVYLALDEEKKALDAFEAALAIHPLLPGARHNAGILKRRLQQREI